MLADFYPHGEVAKNYGILRPEGYAERATFVIDTQGIIRHIEIHEIGKLPDQAKLDRGTEGACSEPRRACRRHRGR